jgi:uncharacterized repeat protein (TIGR03837 family)
LIPHWDIFCRVIDNYGDAAVAWRLARNLAQSHAQRVRLWIDAPEVLAALRPQPASAAPGRIEVHPWGASLPGWSPGDVVVSAFGVALPEPLLQAMAARQPAPVWLNLDYLSFEDWAAAWHGLGSRHPRWPLSQFFYSIGPAGGVLREADLFSRRDAFQNDAAAQAGFFAALGVPPAVPGALRLSFFSYEEAPVDDLLTALRHARTPVTLLVPEGKSLMALQAALPGLSAGQVRQCGACQIRVLPFLPQADYDRLLWAADLNFVRGEDSLMRAVWAGRPLIWQAYPQTGATHLVKLEAFLRHWQADEVVLNPLGAAMRAWNGGSPAPDWPKLLAGLPGLRVACSASARRWEAIGELADGMAKFCAARV